MRVSFSFFNTFKPEFTVEFSEKEPYVGKKCTWYEKEWEFMGRNGTLRLTAFNDGSYEPMLIYQYHSRSLDTIEPIFKGMIITLS